MTKPVLPCYSVLGADKCEEKESTGSGSCREFPTARAGLRGDSGSFVEDGFGADGMNRRQRRSDNRIQVRLLQRERMNSYVLRFTPRGVDEQKW